VVVPLESNTRVVSELASRGYNAEREAVTLLAGADDPASAIEGVVERAADDALRITTEDVRAVLTAEPERSIGSFPPKLRVGHETSCIIACGNWTTADGWSH
jgi:hypothetical protein